jgi:homoserine kinase
MKDRKIRIKSPATSANVGPGYDIFALALENPADIIELTVRDDAAIHIEIENNIQNIPTDPKENSAGLAARYLLKKYAPSQGVNIKIIKKMPSGGGLGTTGASAGATIFGLDRLLQLHLSSNEMIDLARMGEVASGGTAHADNVAASILGGFVLVKSYSPIDVLKIEIPRIPVVLAAIRKSIRTTRGFITYDIGAEKLKEQMARCSRMIHALHTHDLVEFGAAMNQDFIHEPVRSSAIPHYRKVKEEAMKLGAYSCTISGGGSSVIAFCPEDKQAAIAQMMEVYFGENEHFKKVVKTFTSNVGVEIL